MSSDNYINQAYAYEEYVKRLSDILHTYGYGGQSLDESDLTRSAIKHNHIINNDDIEIRSTFDSTEYLIKSTSLRHRSDGPAWKTSEVEGWYQHGVLHRDDGPALIQPGCIQYYQYGRLHRDDGPAIEIRDSNGQHLFSCWYKNGIQYRENGPCMVLGDDDAEVYVTDGKINRIGGPAIFTKDGAQIWVNNGIIHNEGNPAIVHGNLKLYYHRGMRMTEGHNISSNIPKGIYSMAITLKAKIVHCDDKSCCLEYPDGTLYWYMTQKIIKHREDGPAIIYPNGTQMYYIDGKLHRDDGPAVINERGDEYYYTKGKLHSPSATTPAIKLASGTEIFYTNGMLHREGDLPAAIIKESNSDTLVWAKNGLIHRDNYKLPAIKWGSDPQFTSEVIELLRGLRMPGDSNWHKVLTYNTKPVNEDSFYRGGRPVAIQDTDKENVIIEIENFDDKQISIIGAAELKGRLSELGLINATIHNGSIVIRSNSEIKLENCTIVDTHIIIEAPGKISIVGNRLDNSKITTSSKCFLADNELLNKSYIILSNNNHHTTGERIKDESKLQAAFKRYNNNFSSALSEVSAEGEEIESTEEKYSVSDSDILDIPNIVKYEVSLASTALEQVRHFNTIIKDISDSTDKDNSLLATAALCMAAVTAMAFNSNKNNNVDSDSTEIDDEVQSAVI
jgi:hypothetical protein